MDRRAFVAGLAAAVVAALSGCSSRAGSSSPGSGAASVDGSSAAALPPQEVPLPAGPVFAAPTGLARVAVPAGTLFRLPGPGDLIALTVDDGTDSAVLGGYAELCRITGLRATFFCNGINPGWREHVAVLRALVEQDQVFIANHTWSHADLLRADAARISDEVRRNETFLRSTYGVTGRPFLRPPYGYHDARTDAQLADLGYPAVTMWLGSLGDATVRPPARIVALAQQWFLPQHLVIGHANHPPVTTVFGRLVQLLQERRLRPVHLGDVFLT